MSGDRCAWNASMPISAGLCAFHPGSVNSGGTWHVEHLAFAWNVLEPRLAAAASKDPAFDFGPGIAS